MSNALRLASGRFGRVALLDMDRPLVRHAHPHCHVLLKVEGVDTRFSVGERTVVLTNEQPAVELRWRGNRRLPGVQFFRSEHEINRQQTSLKFKDPTIRQALALCR